MAENNLYRAVLKKDFDSSRIYRKYEMPRIPANIPYVVDNIWEYLRPEKMPSRRFAIYASPTPQLALQNASGKEIDRNNYIVCRVDIQDGKCKAAQLSVEDARLHSDVKKLSRLITDILGNIFTANDQDLRTALAPVFTPVLPRTEMQRLANSYTILKNTLAQAEEQSTLWNSASLTVHPEGLGEVFFELNGGALSQYLLHPID